MNAKTLSFVLHVQPALILREVIFVLAMMVLSRMIPAVQVKMQS